MMSKKAVIYSILVLAAVFGMFQLAGAVTKNVGQSVTVTVSCSDADENLSSCMVTSPCSNTCSASGSSGSCTCTFICTYGNFSACGKAIDTHGLSRVACPDLAEIFCNDTTLPIFSYFYVSPSGWTNTNPSWYWSAYDNESGMRDTNRYYIYLDGSDKGFTMNTQYQPDLSSGTHNLYVYAYNKANNYQGSGYVYAKIDKTNPTASLSVNKTSVAPGETITLTINAQDSHSGVDKVEAYYKGSWHSQSCNGASSCAKTWSFSESSYASYTYYGYVYDKVNNGAHTSPWAVSVSVVDTTPPSFSYFNVTPTGWTKISPTWNWLATDSGSGMRTSNRYYVFRPAAWGGGYWTDSISYTAPGTAATGIYDLSVNAYDNANPVNVRGSGVLSAKIDKTKPTTPTINSPGAGSIQVQDFPVSVSGDVDADSGIDKCYYHVYSGAGWTKWEHERKNCDGSFTVTVGLGKDCRISNSTCTVYVFSKDKVGNVSEFRTRSFHIAFEPPISKIKSPNPNLWYSNDVFINVYDEDRSGTGLIACWYRVVNIGWPGGYAIWDRPCNGSFMINIGPGPGLGNICYTQGKDTCEVRVWACDGTNIATPCEDRMDEEKVDHNETVYPYGNYINYNIDYSAPEIKH